MNSIIVTTLLLLIPSSAIRLRAPKPERKLAIQRIEWEDARRQRRLLFDQRAFQRQRKFQQGIESFQRECEAAIAARREGTLNK